MLPDKLCMVRAYYDNPDLLRYHVEAWSELPEYVKDKLTAIIVDDCSPEFPAEYILRALKLPIPIRLFRLDVDIRWNWLGARNIGMSHAPDGWALITDIDHFAPEETLCSILSTDVSERTIYRFGRREHTGETVHPHPNSWLMTKAMFWKVGGFNEAVSGYYGTDGHYRRRVAATAPVEILPIQLVRDERRKDDCKYKRKQIEDAEGKRILRAWGNKPPLVLSFPYVEVAL